MLSFDLHVLTARLDRSADRILRGEFGVSYRRYRALLSVGRVSVDEQGTSTQRAMAEDLGISEPSASRMTNTLVETGLLDIHQDGHRRRLRLTPAGKDLVARCQDLLEERFERVVERSGVSYADYARDTHRLLAALSEA
ncbi:MarR family winged helix-turn-helix transcriptional regulator [Actinophytocola sp.]|uniref:MarR family winged helix-turn-helix transcriptional regulator n=1 Tax=Actinophytocola sp. TaxID=1872138 RepID=UPI002ED0D785